MVLKAHIWLSDLVCVIHQSEGKAGVDLGSGWVQELPLHILDASLCEEILDLLRDLWDGARCYISSGSQVTLDVELDPTT